MGRLFWFAAGAFAGVWWMKRHNNDNWMYERRRRELVANVPQRPILRADHEVDSDTFEVVPKGMFTDADKARLRELGGQATEIATDLSESMIETAFAALENWRQKVAEQKARRERVTQERHQLEEKRV